MHPPHGVRGVLVPGGGNEDEPRDVGNSFLAELRMTNVVDSGESDADDDAGDRVQRKYEDLVGA